MASLSQISIELQLKGQQEVERGLRNVAKSQEALTRGIRASVDVSNQNARSLDRITREAAKAQREMDRLARAVNQGKIASSQFHGEANRIAARLRNLGMAKAQSEVMRYKNALLQASDGQRILSAATTSGTQRLEVFENQIQQTTTAIMAQNTANGRMRQGMSRSSVAIQQTGYQMGDFLVQVQSGTNAFVAFGQQATQMAGLLTLSMNPQLVVLGAALSIAIPLATALGAAIARTSEETEQTTFNFRALFSDIKSTLEPILPIFNALADAVGFVGDSFVGLANVAVGNLDTILVAGGAVAAIFALKMVPALIATTKAMTAFTVASLANPFVLGATAIAASVALIYELSKSLGGVGEALGLLGKAFVEVFKFDSLTNGLAAINAQVASWIFGLIAFLGERVSTLAGILLEPFNQMGAVAQGTIAGVKNVFETVPNVAQKVSAEVANWFIDGFEKLANAGINAINRLIEGLNKLIDFTGADNALEWFGFSGAIGTLSEADFSGMRLQAGNAGAEIADAFNEGFQGSYDSAVMQKPVLDVINKIVADARSASDAMQGLANEYGQAFLDVNPELVKIIESLKAGQGEASDLAKYFEKVGKSGSKAGEDIEDALTGADKIFADAIITAEEFEEQMANNVVNAVDSVANAWADFVMRGFSDFKGFVDAVWNSFKNLIAQMIAMAARNRIMIGLGLAPAGMAGPAMAGGSLLGGGGGGILGGALGSFGSGGSLMGLAGGKGFLGGLGNAISGSISGTGGLGAIFNISGNAIAAGGGFAATLGAALPVIAGATLAIKGLVGSTKELDRGIQVTVSETDILAERFKRIQRTRFFGLSRSTSTRTSELDANAAAQVEAAAALVRDSVFDAANSLGIGADAFDGFVAKIRISTKGLSEDQIATAIAEQMGGIADAMAATIPELAEFARQGETAGDTLLRLANDLELVNSRFRALGFALNDASLAGAAAASSFVELFGSLENFEQSTSFFFTEFYSAAEQLDAGATDLVRTLTELGVSAIPATRAEFRALVSDLMAAGNQAAAASVIQIAPAFVELERLADQVAADAQARANALAQQAQARQSAARSAYDDAVSSFRDAVRRERSQIEDAARDLTGALEDQLREAEQRLRGSTEIYEALLEASTGRRFTLAGDGASLAEGQRILEGFLSRGVIDDPDELDRALKAVADPSENLYADFISYARDFGRTSNTIDKLLDEAEDGVNEDQAAVDALERQLVRNDLWRQQQLERLDLQVTRSTDVFNQVGTVRTATDAVQSAVVNLRGATVDAIDDQISATNIMKNALLNALNQGFQTNVSGGSDPSANDTGDGATTTVGATLTNPEATTYTASDFSPSTRDGVPGVLGPLGGWRSRQELYNSGAISSASSLSSLDLIRLATAMNNGQYPAFAQGGMHTGGLRMVGERGPELEVTGPARIYSNRQTAQMFRDPELKAELRELRREVAGLRRENTELQVNNNKYTKRSYDIYRKWDIEGIPAERT